LRKRLADYEAYLKKRTWSSRRKSRNWRNRLVEMLRDAMLEKAA